MQSGQTGRVINFFRKLFMGTYYQKIPHKLGCIINDISLATENRPEVIRQIRKDVTAQRLLIFRNQGIISGQRHVEITRWFGDLESTFFKHPKSPHPDIFRVSNDEEEGCTGVGRSGWHIDGSFQTAPFSYSLYHMVSVPDRGETTFAPLTEIIEGLTKEKKERWDRLWMVSDRKTGPIHPLIYKHPVTKKEVLCFHLGMTSDFIWDRGTPQERYASPEEFHTIIKEIHNEFVKEGGTLQYTHKWQPGDFIISDNLAVGHEAHPSTQFPPEEVGLRVLHRTTVKGLIAPSK